MTLGFSPIVFITPEYVKNVAKAIFKFKLFPAVKTAGNGCFLLNLYFGSSNCFNHSFTDCPQLVKIKNNVILNSFQHLNNI